jgi:two-component system sensor histidine kinase KdpD
VTQSIWRRAPRGLAPYLLALVVVAATIVVVGLIQTRIMRLPAAIMLYLVPVTVAASRWGRGPAITAAIAAVVGHDVLFVEPLGALSVAIGTLSIVQAGELLQLLLLLFTALVTSELSGAARRAVEKDREAELARRSDELKTALLRAISHELRSPLATIKATVSGLRQSDAPYSEEDRAELLAAIDEEADRLDRLMTNLLDASRLQVGALTPHRQLYEVRELVDRIVDRLEPVLQGRKVTVEVPEDLSPVPLDYGQIDRVMTNLVENAALHTPAGTPVTIRATQNRGEVRVEVIDQGPGVPKSDRERLLRAFERGRTRARGSGLGLAIARGFVEAHGGRLWIDDAPGGGTRLAFTLPLREGTS